MSKAHSEQPSGPPRFVIKVTYRDGTVETDEQQPCRMAPTVFAPYSIEISLGRYPSSVASIEVEVVNV